ncbi:hypothetical protein AVEN_240680-1 [Araneus ventricosus]|uniref:ATP-dependent DNA helicase n=1 Tax=Araneus ventricosus TaxID=182803 RepID=A0A4Y2D630_ARAVE|nr:hypothetical protein AVEN_240680-1 [Araneus ventricosus]
MRETFAFILCYCNPTNVPSLCDKFKVEMSLGFIRNHTEEPAFNFSLHKINSTLKQRGLFCSSFHLPVPTGDAFEAPLYNKLEEQEDAKRRIASLNKQQLHAFNEITGAIYNRNDKSRYFYLDGPGGCGKTYLYSTLLSFVRGKGHVCLAFATTGIAVTLLKDGRTVHSGFKLSVSVLETSVSSMIPASTDAQQLREAKLIIIDEITMLTRDGLRCIDILLKEIMNNAKPFGGKVIVIRGDLTDTSSSPKRNCR